jgi:LmbE family N-acetylglucosaminyl deacetylase
VQVHRVGLRAAELAGTARVFMSTMNRDHIRELTERAQSLGLFDLPDRRQEVDSLGVEQNRITTAVDVSAYLELKRRAMSAHASQISENSFFLAIPPDAFAALWGTEWYIRIGAEQRGELETSLLG